MDGTLERARRAGGAGDNWTFAATVLSDDTILVGGYFNGSATFGPGEGNETILVSDGDKEIFIARYKE